MSQTIFRKKKFLRYAGRLKRGFFFFSFFCLKIRRYGKQEKKNPAQLARYV